MWSAIAAPVNVPFLDYKVGATGVSLTHGWRQGGSVEPVGRDRPGWPSCWIEGELKAAPAPARATEAGPLGARCTTHHHNCSVHEFAGRGMLVNPDNRELRFADDV